MGDSPVDEATMPERPSGPVAGVQHFLARLTSPGGASSPADEQRRRVWAQLARGAVGGVFVLMVIVFSILKPHNFPTTDNAKAILDQAATFAIVGAGLTVVLTIGEFDLSFDAATAIAGSAAVAVMVHQGAGTGEVVVVALAVGALVGTANGTLVAYGRAPAFIGTLAVASVTAGVESWFTKDQPVYEGVSNSYQAITGNSILGIPITIYISIGCVVIAWVLLSFTVYGRRAHAVGSNMQASVLAGIRTKRVRFAAFVFMGVTAGVAGVITTSRAGGSFPNSAQGLLLPTYTAVFLGASALGRRGQFHPVATYFGVIFIGTLRTGLTMVQAPAWTAEFVTGLVLVFAVLVALKK